MKPTDILGNIKLYNADCMEVMKTFKDKQFELAICDPPYGLGDKLAHAGNGKNSQSKFTDDFHRKKWDNEIPSKKYFEELFRISKNQVIFGGNYFGLPPTRCYLVWDKGEGFYNRTYAECELAWTSFDANTCKIKYDPLAKGDYKGKIHPCQKPVTVYSWILQNYAKEGDTILDTHSGSLSIGIACHDMKFDLTAIELDKDYYEQAKQRLINHQRQLTLF